MRGSCPSGWTALAIGLPSVLDDIGDVLFVSAWVLSQFLWLPLLLFVIVCVGVLGLYRRLLSGE